MIAKLLVAYDDSEPAKKAYASALEIASKFGAGMVVLSVVQPPEPPLSIEPAEVMESATKYYQNKFRKLEEQAAAVGIKPRFEIKMGYPAEQIVTAAKAEKTDVVIMGHKGVGVLQEWLVGSVAKRVLTYAPCTVIIVK
jgi:nucleotide-binding universal stress UspA family protein